MCFLVSPALSRRRVKGIAEVRRSRQVKKERAIEYVSGSLHVRFYLHIFGRKKKKERKHSSVVVRRARQIDIFSRCLRRSDRARNLTVGLLNSARKRQKRPARKAARREDVHYVLNVIGNKSRTRAHNISPLPLSSLVALPLLLCLLLLLLLLRRFSCADRTIRTRDGAIATSSLVDRRKRIAGSILLEGGREREREIRRAYNFDSPSWRPGETRGGENRAYL